ncbi:hypothetical protein D3C81_678990 [compost metagenome]
MAYRQLRRAKPSLVPRLQRFPDAKSLPLVVLRHLRINLLPKADDTGGALRRIAAPSPLTRLVQTDPQ